MFKTLRRARFGHSDIRTFEFASSFELRYLQLTVVSDGECDGAIGGVEFVEGKVVSRDPG